MRGKKKRLNDTPVKCDSAELLAQTTVKQAKLRQHVGSGPVLSPPVGYSSWLRYAVETMNTRYLFNDHAWGHEPQWPTDVTRDQMKAAAQAELSYIEGIWGEMERAWAGTIETAEISANPEAVRAIKQHEAGKTKFGKVRDI